MAKKDFQYSMVDGILTPCNVARSWHWFHQVTAPCNVACGCGIMTVNSPSGRLQCDAWHLDDMPLNSPCGSTLQCDMLSGIMMLNSPGISTLQCGKWLWDDMPLNLPKCLPYWNSTSGFDFDHITAVDMSFCTSSLWNFIQIGPPSAEKNDMSVFKMADLSHLGF